MRLARLELLAFGPFRGHTLDLSAPGLHVVFGRNEAGKSTTLRAITGLLYGIPAKTADGHVHKLADLRIGGVVEGAGGARLRVVRRKGLTNTLLDDAGQPLDEAALRRLLGGVSEETFRLAYGLDHDALERGARALLEGKGDLGESLFDASVGGGGEVQRLLAELAAEADRTYRPRATALPLNDALKAFAEAQKAVRERQSLPEAFVRQEEALADAIRRDANARAEREVVAARRARLSGARKRAPLERRRERALAARDAFGALAAGLARVEALRDRFGAYEKALEQRRGQELELERARERLAEASRRAGLAPGGEAEVRLDVRAEGRIQAQLEARARSGERRDALAAEVARLEREVARLGERLAALPPDAGDEERLGRALERARALGDVEGRLREGAARAARQRRDLDAKAAALGLFEGSLEELVALPLPSPAALDGLDERAKALGETLARLEARRAELTRDAAARERQIASAAGDFAPPSAADLAAARAARDAALERARRATAEADRRAADVALEGLLREADALADRMIREADRVTLLARLRSEAEAGARELGEIDAARAAAEASRRAVDEELAALFREAGIRPRGIGEMRTWLDRHALIVEGRAALAEVEAALADERARAESATEELAAALGAEGALSELVAAGARRLAAGAAARQERAETERAAAEKRLALDEKVVAKAREDAAHAEAALRLAELVGPLGLGADAAAEEIHRSLEALRAVFQAADARADVETRLRLADADARAFEADAARALAELAPDLDRADVREAARALFARAAEAGQNERELADLEARLADLEPVALEAEDAPLLADDAAAERVERALGERLEELDGELRRLNQDIGGFRVGLEKLRADSNAAEAAAAAQAHLARVREHAERWARAKLASFVLGREIERFREENQAPLLASTSALFARLTLGAFAAVRSGFDDKDKPTLRCVRGGGQTEVEVAGLSEGTRDQLYLALRLASLLRRAEVADPMPLVLDDVLIQLDDERASAALAVLAEVARTMQVLFFTHHARLVELARAAVPADALVVHELGPTAATAATASL